ncbi:hypothetical protein [Nonomuraea rubra]|uniref:hypothetical protein n=1 Tax=Nonomuraea rubra TaxID=46180 RepID=UPI003CD05489
MEQTATAWTELVHARPGDRAAGQARGRPLRGLDDTLGAWRAGGHVVFRYVGHPNGSPQRHRRPSATRRGTWVGLMPHPEHAVESLVRRPEHDGLGIFTSTWKNLVNA